MPTYDFKCRECGHVFEWRKGMNDPNPPCCAVERQVEANEVVMCGGPTDRLFTLAAPPVHFHGGGWAKDNYSKGGK